MPRTHSKKKGAVHPQQKQKRTPRLAGPCPIGIGFRTQPRARTQQKYQTPVRARGWGSGGIQWGIGRPAGGAFCFLLRCAARLFFAAGAWQVYSLTCCPPPPSIHCRKKSRVHGPFFSLLRVCELTHSLAACRPEQKSTRSKKKRATHPQQKKRDAHPQPKKKAPGTRSKKAPTTRKYTLLANQGMNMWNMAGGRANSRAHAQAGSCGTVVQGMQEQDKSECHMGMKRTTRQHARSPGVGFSRSKKSKNPRNIAPGVGFSRIATVKNQQTSYTTTTSERKCENGNDVSHPPNPVPLLSRSFFAFSMLVHAGTSRCCFTLFYRAVPTSRQFFGSLSVAGLKYSCNPGANLKRFKEIRPRTYRLQPMGSYRGYVARFLGEQQVTHTPRSDSVGGGPGHPCQQRQERNLHSQDHVPRLLLMIWFPEAPKP